MEQKYKVRLRELMDYGIRNAKKDENENKEHLSYLDFSITDKENHIHEFSFYEKYNWYTPAYWYYVECTSPLLRLRMEYHYSEGQGYFEGVANDWDIKSNYDEVLLTDVLELAVQYIRGKQSRPHPGIRCRIPPEGDYSLNKNKKDE